MSDLNQPQMQAVLHDSGPLLIFAGAGSGKTRTITYRIANLLATHRVAPYRILAVTFTNKAAGEMRSRLDKLAGEEVTRDLWIGTFHSVCARLLRRYHQEAGLSRDFVIYDEADQRALLVRILKQMGLDEQNYPPKYYLSRIHNEKREDRTPGRVRAQGPRDDMLPAIYERYEKALASSNAVDFEDLIVRAMHLAENPEGLAGEELRGRFLHVLVDEFQDTNITQYRLVRALAARHRNLCVVGDDDQSIYRWRGADVRLIRGFRQDFADASVIKLEQNYRSTGNIVSAALGVISTAREREDKRLWTEAQAGSKVLVRSASDEREEAHYVARMAEQAIRSGLSAREIAVFYRVHAQSRVLEEAFRQRNIPYQIVGGMKFFERAEIKDVLAYLRLVQNPRSDADVLRILNVPARGLGQKTVERLNELAADSATSVYQAIRDAARDRELGSTARRRLADFLSLIESFRAELDHLSPHELAEQVIERTGYRQVLKDEDSAEADARLGNIEELVGSIQDFETEATSRGEPATLSAYLERVSLVAGVDALKDAALVSLMTVHSAKGLEFNTVFLTGLEEDIFPYRGVGADQRDDEEEERRLAYVAVTRARQQLTITHVSQRSLFGRTRYLEPSRYLRDLPEEVVAHEGGGRLSYGSERPSSARFTNPTRREPERAPGERFIDTSAFDDVSDDSGRSLRPGTRVRHKSFGRGVVERVESGASQIVVARFADGVRRIHASFLELC